MMVIYRGAAIRWNDCTVDIGACPSTKIHRYAGHFGGLPYRTEQAVA
jgi:hypothetical protein